MTLLLGRPITDPFYSGTTTPAARVNVPHVFALYFRSVFVSSISCCYFSARFCSLFPSCCAVALLCRVHYSIVPLPSRCCVDPSNVPLPWVGACYVMLFDLRLYRLRGGAIYLMLSCVHVSNRSGLCSYRYLPVQLTRPPSVVAGHLLKRYALLQIKRK